MAKVPPKTMRWRCVGTKQPQGKHPRPACIHRWADRRKPQQVPDTTRNYAKPLEAAPTALKLCPLVPILRETPPKDPAMNRLLPVKLALSVAVASLCACQSLPMAWGPSGAPATASAANANLEIPMSSLPLVEKRESLTATGYAVISAQNHRIPAQQRLLAIRAAKLDAYRSLTEQVYGLRMDATATVADMVVQNDTFRSKVEGVIYGATLVSITPSGDDTYETTLSLDKATVQDLRMLYLGQLAAKNK